MYPYQRTPMGNPYVSPKNSWVFMGKLSPRNPREHNKYHGYTVRGTPNCPLIEDGVPQQFALCPKSAEECKCLAAIFLPIYGWQYSRTGLVQLSSYIYVYIVNLKNLMVPKKLLGFFPPVFGDLVMVALLMIFPTNFPQKKRLRRRAAGAYSPASRASNKAKICWCSYQVCAPKVVFQGFRGIAVGRFLTIQYFFGWTPWKDDEGILPEMQANHDMDKNYRRIWSAESDVLLESIDSWIPISEPKVPFVSHVT